MHSGANYLVFVWISMDKKKNNVFVNSFYKLDQILKEICVDLLNLHNYFDYHVCASILRPSFVRPSVTKFFFRLNRLGITP